MLQMGEELGRTQAGYNNAFCQDNSISWMRWSDPSPRDEALLKFVQGVASLRADLPLLRCPSFLHGEPVAPPDIPSVRWFKPDREIKQSEHWEDPIAKCVGLSLADEQSHLLLLFNSDAADIAFTLPQFGGKRLEWRLLCDSAKALVRPKDVPLATGKTVVPGRGLLLFERPTS